jgi:hypothetical protein
VRGRIHPLTIAALLLLLAQASRAADAPNPRSELQTMEQALAEAVGRVSRPAAAPVLGAAEACRGYRLPGVGAWFVVSPRLLPERAAPRKREEPTPAKEHESRRRRNKRAQAAAEQERELRAWRARAQETHEAAAEARGEAEAALTMLEKAAESPDTPEGPRRDGGVGEEAPPPWRIWAGAVPVEDSKSAEALLRDVREAIAQTLETHGSRVRLEPSEMIAVAVDFFRPRPMAFSGAPIRTLVVRVPRDVLVARQEGRLSADAARHQFEIAEY